MQNYLKLFESRKVQIIVILILTFLAYSNIFNNQFAGDDPSFLKDYQFTKHIENIPQAFLTKSTPEGHPPGYRPLRNVFLILDYALWQDNILGYHLQSILVHLINTILVYFLALKIFSNLKSSIINHKSLAFITALLFGLHPVHTEAVAYMIASVDSIGTAFAFGCLLAFQKAVENKFKLKFWILSLSLYLLALLTYEITVILPLLILLYLVCFKFPKRDCRKKIFNWIAPFFFLVIAYLLTRSFLLHISYQRVPYLGFSFFHTMIMLPKILVSYLLLTLLPLKLSFFHTIAPGYESYTMVYSNLASILNKNIFDTDILGSILLLIALGLICVKLFRSKPIVLFCFGFFYINLLPVSNIIPVGPALSERYLYMGSFGYCLFLAWVIGNIKIRSGTTKEVVAMIIVIIIATFYLIRTYTRNKDWQDIGTLNAAVIREYPQSLIAHYNRALFYSQKAETLDKAMVDYQTILTIEPKFWEVRFNLAGLLSLQNQPALANEELKQVISQNPDYIKVYISLALNSQTLGKTDLAFDYLNQALKINPNNDKFFDTVQSQAELNSNYATVYLLLAQIQMQSEFEEAAKNLSLAQYFVAEDIQIKQNIQSLVKLHPDLENKRIAAKLPNDSNYLGLFKNYSLVYPKDWAEINSGPGKILLTDKEKLVKVEINQVEKEEELVNVKIVNQGQAFIPNVEKADVKIFEEAGVQKMVFYLFSKNKIIKVLIFPSDKANKADIDLILGSVRIE